MTLHEQSDLHIRYEQPKTGCPLNRERTNDIKQGLLVCVFEKEIFVICFFAVFI